MSEQLQLCPLCQAADSRLLYVARDRHYGIRGDFPIVRCNDCSLVFLNPMYSDAELAKLYPTDYYAYQDNFCETQWKQLAKRVLGYKLTTKEPRFGRPGVMLDLGCGSGWFLKRMRKQGWTVLGVEISEQAANVGRELGGLEIRSGTLQQAHFPPDYFDYVRANHSFEHISCPNETLEEIRRVLKPTGKLMLAVPNIDSLTARMFRNYWWYLGAPVHPFNYSVRTLSRLLTKHGFQVERVSHNSDYYGILGSCQIWLNRGTGQKSGEGRVINNPVLRLTSQWMQNLIDLANQGDSIEITARKSARA